jgi:hypothetical protein
MRLAFSPARVNISSTSRRFATFRTTALPPRRPTTSNMSIQEYIEEHALGKRVEDTINAAVKAKSTEPISFMVRRATL